MEKPVFHMTMRLVAGEFLSKDQLIDIGRSCAKEFDVLDHQYVCILHKDTAQQHIHLIANRVGYDGLAASDSNSYERMSKLSRRLEKEYRLQVVLSPASFFHRRKGCFQGMTTGKKNLGKISVKP